MFERLRQMLIKEFIQVLRDPRMRMVIFITPMIQMIVIGYAVNFDIRNVQTAVYDLDNSELSRQVISDFRSSGYFDVVAQVDRPEQVNELIDRGDVILVLRIDHGFGEDLRAGRTAQLQVILDGSDSNTAGIAAGYVSKITASISQRTFLDRAARLLGATRPLGQIDLRTRAWFNENLESRNFYVPGVIMIVVTLATLLLTSMAVVREKEIGTMEQVIVTPITPLEFILGKTLPFAIVGLIDVILVTLVGTLWFQVPFRGNLALLLAGTIIYLLPTLGIGLLISTISQTQQQAMMSTFFFFFPAMLLSGFAFPIANMPPPVQWLTYANPLRYYLVIIRSIFLKGVGVEILWPQMAALAVMGVAVLWLVSKRFHKTLA